MWGQQRSLQRFSRFSHKRAVSRRQGLLQTPPRNHKQETCSSAHSPLHTHAHPHPLTRLPPAHHMLSPSHTPACTTPSHTCPSTHLPSHTLTLARSHTCLFTYTHSHTHTLTSAHTHTYSFPCIAPLRAHCTLPPAQALLTQSIPVQSHTHSLRAHSHTSTHCTLAVSCSGRPLEVASSHGAETRPGWPALGSSSAPPVPLQGRPGEALLAAEGGGER